MSAQTTQIKVTLPRELYFFLKSKADRFGLSASAYLRSLELEEVKEMQTPVFRMSEKREKIVLEALNDFKAGKTKKITTIDEYLTSR